VRQLAQQASRRWLWSLRQWQRTRWLLDWTHPPFDPLQRPEPIKPAQFEQQSGAAVARAQGAGGVSADQQQPTLTVAGHVTVDAELLKQWGEQPLQCRQSLGLLIEIAQRGVSGWREAGRGLRSGVCWIGHGHQSGRGNNHLRIRRKNALATALWQGFAARGAGPLLKSAGFSR